MSTFDGNIREFPDIQVDYFRSCAASSRPLACFLSHVHSDHLVGLETLRSPFVYCSAATRALVLRLERYPSRLNFAKGILEARKLTFASLKDVLKPLPLETPTTIELSPGQCIRVTLLDANHCPGSVMFLFENTTRAVLYTGDTRCEPWFVNALVRSPCLAEYAAGLRVLDTVYLDTSFIDKDMTFPTKAEGLRELLRAVSQFPPETVFYLRAWTFGYEDVWTALAKALNSKVHVDPYRMKLYQSLTVKGSGHRFSALVHLAPEAPSLAGFVCANTIHEGCLVTDAGERSGAHARIHSCHDGNGYCPDVCDAPAVWIYPIVTRLPGGRGDFAEAAMREPASKAGEEGGGGEPSKLAQTISFPYSRHSSYSELCHLISELRPRDVWPCTVNTDKWFKRGGIVTIKDLFGEYCSGDIFRHDVEVASIRQRDAIMVVEDSQDTTDSESCSCLHTITADSIDTSSTANAAAHQTTTTTTITTVETLGQCEPPFFAYSGKDWQDFQDSQSSTLTEFSKEIWVQAHDAMLHNAACGKEWIPIGLVSTNDGHSQPDVDLGYG